MSDWSSDVCSSDLGHVVAEGVDVAADVALCLRIERGGPLVEDEQLRPAGERAGKRNALALAARQLGALLAHHAVHVLGCSATRRVGKNYARTCRSRWPPYTYKNKTRTTIQT